MVELQLAVAVRPSDAESAKAVGSYGLRYRLHDGDGREWFANGVRTAEPKAGVAMRITVKATVPRSKAGALDLQIQAPKESRQQGPTGFAAFRALTRAITRLNAAASRQTRRISKTSPVT